MVYNLLYLINTIESIIKILLVIRFLISWLAPTMKNSFTDTVYFFTEPLLRPFRSILTFGNIGIDLSPVILVFIISLLKSVLFKIIIFLAYR